MRKILGKMVLIALILPVMGFFLGTNTYALDNETPSVVIASPIKDGIDKSKTTTGMGDEGSDADVNNIVQTMR